MENRITTSGKKFDVKHEKDLENDILEKDCELITRLYREAKNKGSQISILSQVYAKDPYQIAIFLEKKDTMTDLYKEKY